jgi:hypothetical protein
MGSKVVLRRCLSVPASIRPGVPARTSVGAARPLFGACLAVLCLSLAFASPQAQAVGYVDGISDQHLGSWAGTFSEASGFNAPFPSFFADSWVGSPPAHIKLARYVVQWDVMTGVGKPGELTNLEGWYNHAIEMGLTPELALANYNCSGCTAPAKTEYYTRELEALHKAFPSISIYEAWNEPNLGGSFHVSAETAAHLMNALYSFCSGHGCTTIAGDFADSESNMTTYEEEYKKYLSPSDPGNWGIHLYHAVKYENKETLVNFEALLPNKTKDKEHVWFTEVGSYYCEFGENRGTATQEKNAKFLVGLVAEQNPVHAFYYQAAWPNDEKPPCNSETLDTALYAAESTNGPVHARPAASVIFGAEGAPTATTGAASGVQQLQATVSGTVNPEGIDDAKYYFQYGTSTSYGSTTPLSDAGPGLNPVGENATVTGLTTGTTYHYRIVATSAGGEVKGNDQTFTTLEQPDVFFADANASNEMSSWTWSEPSGWQMRSFLRDQVAAKSSPSALVWNGTPNVFFADKNDNGELSDWTWSAGAGWQLQSLFQHEVEPGTSPAALMINGNPHVFFSDKADNGEVSDWNWNSKEGWHITPFYGDKVAAGSSPYAFMGGESYSSARTYTTLQQPDVFFADANYNGSVGDFWSSTSGWQSQNLFQDSVAAKSSPTGLMWNGAPNVFFSDGWDNGEVSDWSWSSASGWQLQNFFQDEVEPETSPSALMVNGNPNVFFSDKADNGEVSDWNWNSTEGWHVSRFYVDAVAAGTSPSSLMVNGTPNVFFSDRNDNGEISDWTWHSTEGWHLQNVFQDEVEPGTSPSAMMVGSTTPEVFFADKNYKGEISDWFWNSTYGWLLARFGGDEIEPGTSPSAMMVNGSPEIFFSDKNDNGEVSYFTWNEKEGWHIVPLYQDEVVPGTSPSAVMVNGTPNVFFSDKNYNGDLSDWAWNSTEGWHLTRLYWDQVAAGSSPDAIE